MKVTKNLYFRLCGRMVEIGDLGRGRGANTGFVDEGGAVVMRDGAWGVLNPDSFCVIV